VPLPAAAGCNDRVFNLSASAAAVPTLGTWGFVFTIAVLMGIGAYYARRGLPTRPR
jgi:hypothetical protein